MVERIVEGSNLTDQEKFLDCSLRPKTFSEFIGQKTVVSNIDLMVKSCLIRNTSMDHVLFSGPPGLGKTTLAYLVGGELGRKVHIVSGPAIENKGDFAATLANFESGDILFIDEIHRINITIEEMLYSVMEDFRLDIIVGKGVSARTMQIDIPSFTLIGATTRAGLLSGPLRDRFVANLQFEFYGEDELVKMAINNCKVLSIELSKDALSRVARCARGTPRIMNRILRRVRDYALVNKLTLIDLSAIVSALDMMEIDLLGLDAMDRKILRVMLDFYGGGPVGIEALSSTLSENRQTVEEVYEPYLLKSGLILRTGRGRILSELAKEHLQDYFGS